MKKAILLGVCAAALAATGFAAGRSDALRPDPMSALVTPAAAAEAGASKIDKAEIEAIIHDYLVNNPEVLIEAEQALEKKQSDAEKATQAKVIQSASKELFHASYDGVIGNPHGKVNVVEFFDYNCHFCRGALPDMQNLVAKNPDVRFILKEFPILGADSQKATIVSMAFHKLLPQKYGAFHVKLLGTPGRVGEDTAIKVALSLGADEAALRKAMKDPEIIKDVNANYELANKLDITGTPAYVIGKDVISGALGEKALQQQVAQERACQKSDSCS